MISFSAASLWYMVNRSLRVIPEEEKCCSMGYLVRYLVTNNQFVCSSDQINMNTDTTKTHIITDIPLNHTTCTIQMIP